VERRAVEHLQLHPGAHGQDLLLDVADDQLPEELLALALQGVGGQVHRHQGGEQHGPGRHRPERSFPVDGGEDPVEALPTDDEHDGDDDPAEDCRPSTSRNSRRAAAHTRRTPSRARRGSRRSDTLASGSL
jgi:hypothetical protein